MSYTLQIHKRRPEMAVISILLPKSYHYSNFVRAWYSASSSHFTLVQLFMILKLRQLRQIPITLLFKVTCFVLPQDATPASIQKLLRLLVSTNPMKNVSQLNKLSLQCMTVFKR